MLFAGIRRKHSFAEAGSGIPKQWTELETLWPLPNQVGNIAYGALCGGDEAAQTMEYMCAAEVESFEGLPTKLGRMRVPPVRYAVFLHEGNVAGIRRTWQQIMSEWLPRSGFRSANTPDFERYDERFDPASGEGGVEIWLGVVPEGGKHA